jgi:hypothetical protein
MQSSFWKRFLEEDQTINQKDSAIGATPAEKRKRKQL